MDRIGRFCVSSVYVPGVKTSAIVPSLTNTATWPSRTISLAPILISFSWRGKRQTIVSRLSSVHSMMSISSPRSLSMNPTVLYSPGQVPGARSRRWLDAC